MSKDKVLDEGPELIDGEYTPQNQSISKQVDFMNDQLRNRIMS